MISEELKRTVREAFVAYETVFIERIVKKPGWRLAGDHCEQVIASGDEARIRAYVEDLNVARRDLENALDV